MAHENSSTTWTSFLSLPSELRSIVYDHLLSTDKWVCNRNSPSVMVRTENPNAQILTLRGVLQLLTLRGVSQHLNAEVRDFYFSKAKISINISNQQVNFHQILATTPNWAFIAAVQHLHLKLDIETYRPCEDQIALFEQVLRKLNAEKNLKSFKIEFGLHRGGDRGDGQEDKLKEEQTNAYTKPTICRMRAVRDGKQKGLSAVETEIQFGLKAVEILQKLQEENLIFRAPGASLRRTLERAMTVERE